MSEITFNIADYRPLAAVRTQRSCDRSRATNRPRGFVVLSSNAEPREYNGYWPDAKPAVVDIRSVRDTYGAGRLSLLAASRPCRGKILRFTNVVPGRNDVTASEIAMNADQDSDPTDIPPAA
jgi:hypothetical protein